MAGRFHADAEGPRRTTFAFQISSRREKPSTEWLARHQVERSARGKPPSGSA